MVSPRGCRTGYRPAPDEARSRRALLDGVFGQVVPDGLQHALHGPIDAVAGEVGAVPDALLERTEVQRAGPGDLGGRPGRGACTDPEPSRFVHTVPPIGLLTRQG